MLLEGRVLARYNSHEKRWEFTIIATGETRVYGARTGEKIVEFLRAVEAAEDHEDIKRKVGLGDHPAVGSGAVEIPRGDQL